MNLSDSSSDTEVKILKAIESSFGINTEDKTLMECTPDTIEEWDSLSFLNLVLALEEEFGISISPDDIGEMTGGGIKLLEVICRYLY